MLVKLYKKTQIHVLEQILVIVIFSFILLIVLITYFIYQKEDVLKKQEYLEEEEAIKLAEIVVHMSELSSPTFIEKAGSFLDLEKIRIFSNLSKTSLGKDLDFMKVYGNMLQYSNITIKIIYPINESYNIYDFPPPENVSFGLAYSGYTTIFYPYIVYDPYNKTQYFSIIEIKRYTRLIE